MAQKQQAQRALWVNERTAPGKVEVNGKTFSIGKYEWPCDLKSEHNTIGCILVAGESGNGRASLKKIQHVLRYDDFYWMRYSYIYWAMERIYERGAEIDLTTVISELSKHKRGGQTLLENVGGEAFLAQFMSVLAVNLESYAHNVVDASLRRATMVAGDVLKEIGQNRRIEGVELAQEIQKSIEGIIIRLHALTDINTYDLSEVIEEYSQRVEQELVDEDYEPGIKIGFTWIDKKLLGWRKQKMYVIAGSAGMGKSVFLGTAALDVVKRGKRALFISLEMPLTEVIDRFVCAWAGIDNERFQERKLNIPEREKFRQAVQEIKALREDQKLIIVCMNNPTMKEIRAKFDELEFAPGFDIAFIDYAGWNTISDGGAFRGNTVAHTGSIYNELNQMKKDFDMPIVVGCQISRDHEKRKDKRPRLSDLSDSSLIEKNADAVIFLFRPEKYEELPEYPDRAEAIIAKNRSGKGGNKQTEVVYLKSELHFNRFSDWRLPSEADNVSVWRPDDF